MAGIELLLEPPVPDVRALLRGARNFFGDTEAIAEEFGVSPETVRRWYSPKGDRVPGLAIRQKMAGFLPVVVTVKGKTYNDSPTGKRPEKNRTRDRTFRIQLEPGDLADIQESLVAGDEEGAEALLFEIHGMNPPNWENGTSYRVQYGRKQ